MDKPAANVNNYSSIPEIPEAVINLHSLAYPVTALGPGSRLVLWVAGCPLRCQACMTPQLQEPSAGKQMPIDSLISHIHTIPLKLAGLTLSGGEPFSQAASLQALLKQLKHHYPHWNYLAFSGYPLQHIQANPEMKQLVEEIDMLIDGPYLPQYAVTHPLIASSNQKLHALTARGQQLKSQINQLQTLQINLGLNRQQQGALIGVVPADRRDLLRQQTFITKK